MLVVQTRRTHMNSISVWKDQILMFWDGELPPSARHIPRDAAMHEPDVVVPHWEHLKGRLKWSKTIGAFIMSFSVQNLSRLYKQFGEINVKQGHGRIADLKNKREQLRSTARGSMSIKDGKTDHEQISYKMPPLAPYQDLGVRLLTFSKTVPLFADCGVGKTYMVITSTQEQFRRGLVTPGKVLVCGKLATLYSGWMEDVEKFSHMKAVVVWAKPGKNRKQKLLELLNTPADVYIINHDGVRVLEEELCKKEFEKVVIDESTILKGFKGTGKAIKGGAFGKSLLKVAKNAKWRVIMTGTPAPNGPHDLWGQFYFLDPDGIVLEKSIKDFNAEYMKEVVFGHPSNKNAPRKWVPREDSVSRISKLISPLMYRVRIRDHLKDLPEKTVVPRKISMGTKQLKHYEEMEKDLCTQLENEDYVSVDMKLTVVGKLRQITGGFIIDHKEESHEIVDHTKIAEMDSLLLDEISHEDKVVVYAQYRHEIKLLEDRYKDMGAVTVYGGNSASKNLENIDKFIKDKDARICILHPKSAAHGITFTCSHYMIFYSISHSAEDNYQCVARIERAGQRHPMFVYYLLADGSIDNDIMRVISTKDKNQRSLIDKDVENSEEKVFDSWMSRVKDKYKKKKTKK